MYIAHEKGMKIKVFSDETRPLLQGARLTAYELHSAGIDVTSICDSAAPTVMRNGWVQAVFVGCDRVAANGDFANKIGTSAVALAAKRFGIPFYVCAPTSTIDLGTKSGSEIVIEERDGKEVSHMWYEKPMIADGVKIYNPAFDVTDHDLVTGFVIEYGITHKLRLNRDSRKLSKRLIASKQVNKIHKATAMFDRSFCFKRIDKMTQCIKILAVADPAVFAFNDEKLDIFSAFSHKVGFST